MWFSRSLLALFAYLFSRYNIFLISFIICIMHTDIAVYLDRNRDRIRLPRLFLYTQRNKVRSLLSTFNLYEVQQLRFEMYAMIRVVRFKKKGGCMLMLMHLCCITRTLKEPLTDFYHLLNSCNRNSHNK